MSKYIDAEKLIAEIEKQKKYLSESKLDERGAIIAYDIVLRLIHILQQEQPEEICSKCLYHRKDDDYCYYPYGRMQSPINENGVYECNGFEEVEKQEQSKVDFRELENTAELIANGIMIGVQANKYHTCIYNKSSNDFNHSHLVCAALKGIEFGINAKKEE